MPPKKNKKPGRNGFWQFVLECRDKQTQKNMEEIKTYAAQKWANMTKEQKRPYEEMAMLARDTFRPVKLTSDGLEIDEVERKEQEAVSKQQSMKEEITRNLRNARIANNLEDQIFLLVHINHLTYHPATDKYYICEIAICAFNLDNGIDDIFHRIVKPGKLPLGFYGPALTHSKETHQLIEVVQEAPFEDNTRQVFRDVVSFMKRYSSARSLPILYAEEKTWEMTTKVFFNFCEEFNFPEEIKIYNFQYMFYALKNAVAGGTVWPSETFSYNEVEKDVFSYCPNISCDYHEVSDVTQYCSRAIVTRHAYTVCDNCCSHLNIQLVAGRHVPEKARIVHDSIRSNSKASSMCSINDSSNQQRPRTDSLSSGWNEENYPPLGDSQSSASSMISFSSMKSPNPKGKSSGVSTSKAANRIDESVRSFQKMKFPAHGYTNAPGRSQ